MIRKDCNDCIKRKTMFCPNSQECLCTFEKTYHLTNIEALEEIEMLNKVFDNLEVVIKYYVIGNSKYDDITAEYILNRLLQFRTIECDKE